MCCAGSCGARCATRWKPSVWSSPSAGNAAAAGFKTYIFVPERAPKGKVAQLMIFGANVISVKGNYEETFKMSAEAIEKYGWYNRNAAINPYLSEGKKTVALEIAEQLNCEAETITADTSFKDDLGADSLDLFELVMALEEEYGLEIPAEELSDVETVGDIIEYLKNKGVED